MLSYSCLVGPHVSVHRQLWPMCLRVGEERNQGKEGVGGAGCCGTPCAAVPPLCAVINACCRNTFAFPRHTHQVACLAADHDAFMRRHAIRVDTQVVDRAMDLLQVCAGVRWL